MLLVGGLLPGFCQTKEGTIQLSYYVAFGRHPNAAELSYWMSQPDQNLVQRVEGHRNFLRQSAEEAYQAIARSYISAYGVGTSDDQIRNHLKDRPTFSEMMDRHVSYMRGRDRSGLVTNAFQKVYGRAASAAEIQYWQGVGDITYDQLVARLETNRRLGRGTRENNVLSNQNLGPVTTSLLSPGLASQLRSVTGGNVIASGSGNVIASGSGNVIASGSGNVIASGSGNLQPVKMN